MDEVIARQKTQRQASQQQQQQQQENSELQRAFQRLQSRQPRAAPTTDVIQ